LPGYGDNQQIEELSETYRRLAARKHPRKAWVLRPTAANRGLEPPPGPWLAVSRGALAVRGGYTENRCP
jgi:hypothetical protein